MVRAKDEESTKQITSLQDAMKWDHRTPGLSDINASLASELDRKGLELFAEAEEKNSYLLGKKIYQKAYQHFLDSMRLDPSRSWTRRRLEEARDKYLKIKRPAQKRAEKKEREKLRNKKKK
jgi:hypothetical protein